MFQKIYIAFFLMTGAAISSQAQNLTLEAKIRTAPEIKVDLYPNPATDYLTVEFEQSPGSSIQFELRSLIGTSIRISPENIGSNRYRIPLKDYATGYYFLIVKNESARYKKAFKFLKR
ncbi:MAG: hypothetical protein ACI8QD_001337 [Cyclobacteriaceae bacterium]|jgi:hypothetical protein